MCSSAVRSLVIALSHESLHAPVAASPATSPLLLLLLSWWFQGVVRAGMLTLPSREHFMVSIGKLLPVPHQQLVCRSACRNDRPRIAGLLEACVRWICVCRRHCSLGPRRLRHWLGLSCILCV